MTRIDRGEIHKLIALPVIALAVAFLTFFIGFLVWRNAEATSRMSEDFQSEIHSNMRYFAQEIYLGQSEAYQKRLRSLNDSFQKRYASAEICIDLVTSGEEVLVGTPKCKRQEINPFQSFAVSVGSDDIATLKVHLVQRIFDSSLALGIMVPLAGALLFALAFQVLLVKRIFGSIVEPFLLQLAEKERLGAIAQTTQALAHDVRKPFSMFKMIIDAVECEEDPLEAKQLLKESLPEVQQAMASVNGMISDVLEIGSESAPILEPTNPETLIESTLNEIFRVYPDSQIDVSYMLNHAHKVSVDTLKVGRVFSNIVGNAVQAMNQKGKLWFKTEVVEEHGNSFVKFCLGNGGSFIPPESLSKLFDAFFTSGKKGGTGLGLAIAQKIVTAHGGKIWCESDAQRGVEFFFTLPCSNELIDQRPAPLTASSTEITATFERLRKTSNASGRVEADPFEVTLEKEIIKLAKAASTPIKVLVVDDEGVYRNSLASLITRSDDLMGHVALSFARNSHEALKALKASPALVVQDVDLGSASLNGYEVLRTIRSQGYEGVVCIHSNRTSPDDYKVAVEAGADAVLPKPMSRTHFLKLLLQAAERAHEQTPSASVEPQLPEFALLDDSKLTLRAWQRKMAKEAVVHVFVGPKEFHAHVKANKGFLEGLHCVVTDFYFAEGVLETGFTFAQDLRSVFAKPILLCSDGDFTSEMIEGHLDAVIPKEPVSWREIASKVATINSKNGRINS